MEAFAACYPDDPFSVVLRRFVSMASVDGGRFFMSGNDEAVKISELLDHVEGLTLRQRYAQG